MRLYWESRNSQLSIKRSPSVTLSCTLIVTFSNFFLHELYSIDCLYSSHKFMMQLFFYYFRSELEEGVKDFWYMVGWIVNPSMPSMN
jgi:hypothetical protein